MTGRESAKTARNSTFQEELFWMQIDAEGVIRKLVYFDRVRQVPPVWRAAPAADLEAASADTAAAAARLADMPGENECSRLLECTEGCLSMLKPLHVTNVGRYVCSMFGPDASSTGDFGS